MTVVRWAMKLAPMAVFGLMAQLTTQTGLGAMVGMAFYVFTVLFGLLIMLCFYMLLLLVFVNEKPLEFLRASRDVLLLAFSTSGHRDPGHGAGNGGHPGGWHSPDHGCGSHTGYEQDRDQCHRRPGDLCTHGEMGRRQLGRRVQSR